jgi:GntR family transcriptional regulator
LNSSLNPSFDLPRAPLHARIKHILRTRILDGTYAPLAQMPSESALGAMFGVSRITVRQALGSLQKEGMIFTLQGKGSFVARRKAFQNITTLMGFAESMSAMGYEVINELLDFHFIPAEPYVVERLELSSGSTIAKIRRVRLLNRKPVSLEVTYVPEALGHQLATADLAIRDIFLLIESDFGTPLGHADLTIDAALADEEIASALHLDEGAPVLHIERLTHDLQNRPIDFEHLFFRADAFQYQLRIDRQRLART